MSLHFRQSIYKMMKEERQAGIMPIGLYALIGTRAENLKIKDLAALSEPHLAVANVLLETGLSVRVNDKIRRLRKELNLSELPSTILVCARSLEDLRKIAQITGFDKQIVQR